MDDALLQAVPARDDWPSYDIDLASPELPCGAAWLVNCLLELGVPAWKAWGDDDHARWQALGHGRFRYVGGDDGWSRVLPALRDGREFRFRRGRCVRAHHAWPGVFPPSRFSLLFVRDPRDALISAWHRQRAFEAIAADTSFQAFVAQRYFHYPLSWLGYACLFLRVWRCASERADLRIVRFEDYRNDAAATLDGVLRHLRIEATPRQIADATAASSVARVRSEDRRLVELGVVATPIVRGAPPGEHRLHLDTATRDMLDHRLDDVCGWLGYAVEAAPARPAPAPSGLLDAVLDAIRRSGVPLRSDGWLPQAVARCLDGLDAVV